MIEQGPYIHIGLALRGDVQVMKVLSVAALVAATFSTGTVAEAAVAPMPGAPPQVRDALADDPVPPLDGLLDLLPPDLGGLLDDVVPPFPRAQLFVDPAGDDTHDGSLGAPLRTIQAALNKALPGTQINLAAGAYHEQPRTVVSGRPGAPITIKGPEVGTDVGGRRKAVLYGVGRIFNIDHSYYTLDGFTIDGQEALRDTKFPTDLDSIAAFKDSIQAQVKDDKLIYVGSADTSRDITGVVISNMYLRRAGTECVRLRNNSHHNLVVNSLIEHCGVFGKKDPANPQRFEYHNGEGIYIGTSPKNTTQPMYKNDPSSGNVVAYNVIRTLGSECFDVKENAHDNVLVRNSCAGNTEPAIQFQGSNVELRGHSNIVRNNKIFSSAGVNVKIQPDGAEWDKGGNSVVDNEMSDAPFALQFGSLVPTGPMCGNVATTKELVFHNNTGVYGDDATAPDFTAPC
jgi:hypothetical protein